MGGKGRDPEPSDIGRPHTLEGYVVPLSDKLAYINHDMDDAIRGGILTEETYRPISGKYSEIPAKQG